VYTATLFLDLSWLQELNSPTDEEDLVWNPLVDRICDGAKAMSSMAEAMLWAIQKPVHELVSAPEMEDELGEESEDTQGVSVLAP